MRVGEKEVVREVVVDRVEASPGGGVVAEGLAAVEDVEEVHHARQVRVDGVELVAALPECRAGLVGIPALAHDVEIGVFAEHVGGPPRHSLHVGIGIGVHADAVDLRRLYPPYRVLGEILHQMRVALVEVGHGGHEPGVDRMLEVIVGDVGVVDGGEAVVGHRVALGMVEPVGRRGVLHPGVVGAGMIEDHVHHHLQTPLVGVLDQGVPLLVGAEAGVDVVIVGGGVSVIASARHVVLKHGADPYGRDAE